MAKNRDNFSVIPAHAGVIPDEEITQRSLASNTRTRGGDPRI